MHDTVRRLRKALKIRKYGSWFQETFGVELDIFVSRAFGLDLVHFDNLVIHSSDLDGISMKDVILERYGSLAVELFEKLLTDPEFNDLPKYKTEGRGLITSPVVSKKCVQFTDCFGDKRTGKPVSMPGFEEYDLVLSAPSGNTRKGTKTGWTLWEKHSGHKAWMPACHVKYIEETALKDARQFMVERYTSKAKLDASIEAGIRDRLELELYKEDWYINVDDRAIFTTHTEACDGGMRGPYTEEDICGILGLPLDLLTMSTPYKPVRTHKEASDEVHSVD